MPLIASAVLLHNYIRGERIGRRRRMMMMGREMKRRTEDNDDDGPGGR